MNRLASILHFSSVVSSLRALAALLGLWSMIVGVFASTSSVLIHAARINADQTSVLAWVSAEPTGAKEFSSVAALSDDSSAAEDEDLDFADDALTPSLRSMVFALYATDNTKFVVHSFRYSFELKRHVHRPPEAYSV